MINNNTIYAISINSNKLYKIVFKDISVTIISTKNKKRYSMSKTLWKKIEGKFKILKSTNLLELLYD